MKIPNRMQEHWKVMIVDDDVGVHDVTKLVLGDFSFDGQAIEFVSAYSDREAREAIQAHPDTAAILLDVVMDDDDSGLKFVRYLREELNNQLIRIILRTGQPGIVPEEKMLADYDINDYKTKTELTSQKLFNTMIVALRSFRDLMIIQTQKDELADTHEQLKQLNGTLEHRVSVRTMELEQANHELRGAQNQLIMQEKMASLGNLAAGVAHEINTPIGAVNSASDVLSRCIDRITHIRIDSNETVEAIQENAQFQKVMELLKDNTQIVVTAGKRVAQIVQSLRNFARLDEAEYQKADLHEGLDSTLTLLQHKLGDRISVIKEYGEIPEILCYPNELNQIFMNLLLNASQAIGDTGEITIRTFQKDNSVYVAIKDTGVGIPEDHFEQVFDPGFTTKGVGVGTGLGLSLCYQIVQNHKGEIKAESEVGKGSTFTVRVPIVHKKN